MRGRRVVGILGIAALAGGAYLIRRRTAAAEEETMKSAGTYVDPAVCASCHSEIWQTYRKTGMGRSFSRVDAGSFREGSFYHKGSDSYFTMAARDGRFYQGRRQIGFGGKETNVLEKQIDYVVGVWSKNSLDRSEARHGMGMMNVLA